MLSGTIVIGEFLIACAVWLGSSVVHDNGNHGSYVMSGWRCCQVFLISGMNFLPLYEMGFSIFMIPILLINPINPIASDHFLMSPLAAMFQTGLRHAFAQATLFNKLLLQSLQLLIQQVVGLVNQANCDVSDHFVGSGFYKLTI